VHQTSTTPRVLIANLVTAAAAGSVRAAEPPRTDVTVLKRVLFVVKDGVEFKAGPG
jgi:hypothetical protein